jgi:hypothetical protein
MNLKQAKAKLKAYQDLKLSPGGFLSSILQNDLLGAVLKADPESKKIVAEITQYCWDNLPHNIWGSHENMEAHLFKKIDSSKPTHAMGIDIELK